MTGEDRFFLKVKKAGSDECWLWLGRTVGRRHQDGRRWYGGFWKDGRDRVAHAVSWEMANHRPVPDGMCVLHTCDNSRCVNPAHLWIGTKTQNNADRVGKGRHRTRKWMIPECQRDNYETLRAF